MLIKQIRQQSGLSLRTLALRAEMSYTYLCNVENEKADPSLSMLRRLAKALGVTLFELLADEETRSVKKKKSKPTSTRKGR